MFYILKTCENWENPFGKKSDIEILRMLRRFVVVMGLTDSYSYKSRAGRRLLPKHRSFARNFPCREYTGGKPNAELRLNFFVLADSGLSTPSKLRTSNWLWTPKTRKSTRFRDFCRHIAVYYNCTVLHKNIRFKRHLWAAIFLKDFHLFTHVHSD